MVFPIRQPQISLNSHIFFILTYATQNKVAIKSTFKMCLQLSMLHLLVLRRKDCLPDIQMTSIEMDEHAETSREKPEKFTGVIQ